MANPHNKVISFALPVELFALLKSAAKKNGRSISGQIRFLIEKSAPKNVSKN